MTEPFSHLGIMVYGTAWKKDKTSALVFEAIKAGFRTIDSAAQPAHYAEALVGQGLRDAIAAGIVCRSDLCIQTKFSPGQTDEDETAPYKSSTSISEQVKSSIAWSLQRLATSNDGVVTNNEYLDCVLLHAMFPRLVDTLQAWDALMEFVPGRIRSLGVCNVDLGTLKLLQKNAPVKPVIVQNRFYAATGYDRELRQFCKEHRITYQAFWTLTANPSLLISQPVIELAREVRIDPAAALYSILVLSLKISVLNGTTSQSRMTTDLLALQQTRAWVYENELQWQNLSQAFDSMLVANSSSIEGPALERNLHPSS